MTTSRSPISVLRAQARKIAAALKASARGEKIAHDPVGKIEGSKTKGSVKFAIAMDDGNRIIEMKWDTIRLCSEEALAEFIVQKMRKEAVQ